MRRECFVDYELAKMLEGTNYKEFCDDRVVYEDNPYHCHSGLIAKRSFKWYYEEIGLIHTAKKGEFFFNFNGCEFEYDEGEMERALDYEYSSPDNSFFGYFFLNCPTLSDLQEWLLDECRVTIVPSFAPTMKKWQYDVYQYEENDSYSKHISYEYFNSFEDALLNGTKFVIKNYVLKKK